MFMRSSKPKMHILTAPMDRSITNLPIPSFMIQRKYSKSRRWEVILIPQEFIVLNDPSNNIQERLVSKSLGNGMDPGPAED